MNKKHLLLIICILLIPLIYAGVPDADMDGVPDADDLCLGSITDLVDQAGCTCEQKTTADCITIYPQARCCKDDGNPCTDDCGVVDFKVICNVPNDNNYCGEGKRCQKGICIEEIIKEREPVIEITCTADYTVDWHESPCSEANCMRNTLISCNHKTEGYWLWKRTYSSEICQSTAVSGQCSPDKLKFCKDGNWIFCEEDKFCIDNACIGGTTYERNWHSGVCDASYCKPNEYLRCETETSGSWFWKKTYYREICLETPITIEGILKLIYTKCGNNICEQGETGECLEDCP
jgi:hypothetical protein